MLSGDAHEESESAKLQVKLEASILAISGKFEAYDVETTQPLDTAMDSMEIDSEIRMSPSPQTHAHARTRTTTGERPAFLGRRYDLPIPFWETCTAY